MVKKRKDSDERRPSSACKECILEKCREYREANPEKFRESWKRSEQRPERRQKQLEKAKTPQMREKQKQWRKNNADKLRGYCHKRRAMKENLVNDLTEEQWQFALEFFGHSCAYCGKSEEENREESGWALEREHVVPLTKGGGYTATNIIPACRKCNGSKFNSDFDEWYPQQDFFSQERYDRIIAYFSAVLVAKYSNDNENRDNRFFFIA